MHDEVSFVVTVALFPSHIKKKVSLLLLVHLASVLGYLFAGNFGETHAHRRLLSSVVKELCVQDGIGRF